MQSAREFIEAYLAEEEELREAGRQWKDRIHRKFHSAELLEALMEVHASRHEHPPILSRLEVSDDTAIAVTTEWFRKKEIKQRHHLRQSGGRWEIHKVEWGCKACGNIGRLDDEPCSHCDGSGWTDFFRDLKRDWS